MPPPKVTVRPPQTTNLDGSPLSPILALIINRDGSVADMGNVASGWSGMPLGYQQLNTGQLATVQALSPPAGATRAMIQNNGSVPARWRDDGPDPTAETGQRIYDATTLDYRGDLTKFRTIREQDGAALDVLYYG